MKLTGLYNFKNEIHVFRIYDKTIPEGYRVLVDRLWPRGISKEKANLNCWWKEIAPEAELRRWFNHDAKKWNEFRLKYLNELDLKSDIVEKYLEKVNYADLIILYGAKEKQYNHAWIIKEYLERR